MELHGWPDRRSRTLPQIGEMDQPLEGMLTTVRLRSKGSQRGTGLCGSQRGVQNPMRRPGSSSTWLALRLSQPVVLPKFSLPSFVEVFSYCAFVVAYLVLTGCNAEVDGDMT